MAFLVILLTWCAAGSILRWTVSQTILYPSISLLLKDVCLSGGSIDQSVEQSIRQPQTGSDLSIHLFCLSVSPSVCLALIVRVWLKNCCAFGFCLWPYMTPLKIVVGNTLLQGRRQLPRWVSCQSKICYVVFMILLVWKVWFSSRLWTILSHWRPWVGQPQWKETRLADTRQDSREKLQQRDHSSQIPG